MNRREFAKTLAVTAAASPTVARATADSTRSEPWQPRVHLFSKHLQFLDYNDAAAAAKQMGFDGLDLTVRPRGHVAPERAKEDLPRAVAALEKHGLRFEMMTTAITSPTSPHARNVLETAASLGGRYYRMGYYRFDEDSSWQANLDRCREQAQALAKLNASLGLHGAYQNHAGKFVGAYVTDIAYFLRGTDPAHAGCQFDIRHATVEGARAWPKGLRFLQDRISTIVAKDFTWKIKDGNADLRNVPLGDGITPFADYFQQLRKLGIRPVVSLHTEYELGGAEHGSKSPSIPKKKILRRIEKDLKTFRELWAQHYR